MLPRSARTDQEHMWHSSHFIDWTLCNSVLDSNSSPSIGGLFAPRVKNTTTGVTNGRSKSMCIMIEAGLGRPMSSACVHLKLKIAGFKDRHRPRYCCRELTLCRPRRSWWCLTFPGRRALEDTIWCYLFLVVTVIKEREEAGEYALVSLHAWYWQFLIHQTACVQAHVRRRGLLLGPCMEAEIDWLFSLTNWVHCR